MAKASSKMTDLAMWAALFLPLLYAVPTFLKYKEIKSKGWDAAMSKVGIFDLWRLGGTMVIVMLVALITMALAAYAMSRRAPVGGIVALVVCTLVSLVSRVLAEDVMLRSQEPGLISMLIYIMPLAIGTVLGSSVATSVNFATELRAAAWVRALAAVAVPGVFVPLAAWADTSNPLYPVATAATKAVTKLFKVPPKPTRAPMPTRTPTPTRTPAPTTNAPA